MVDLNYRIDGSGPRVLLLHAVGMDLTLLDALAAIMAKDFAAAYFPLNTGLRFSRKARCASLASSVCDSATVTVCSKR